MATANFITALLLFFAALFCCFWFIGSIISPFFKGSFSFSIPSLIPRPGFGERWKFRRSTRSLEQVDRLIAEKEFRAAGEKMYSALYLEVVQFTPELVAKSTHHHTDVLARLLTLAEEQSATIRNLPILEELISKRGELLKAVFETRAARHRFKTKRQAKGKNTPSWSTKDFEERLKQLHDELRTNSDTVRKQLRDALQELSSPSIDSESSHYH